jgi:hypothetical protein
MKSLLVRHRFDECFSFGRSARIARRVALRNERYVHLCATVGNHSQSSPPRLALGRRRPSSNPSDEDGRNLLRIGDPIVAGAALAHAHHGAQQIERVNARQT